MTIAPFNFAQDYTNTLKLRAIGVASIALAVALSIGAVTTERQWQRTLLLMSALGMTGVSRVAEDARLTQARINKDVVDISDASRQQRLYEYMTSNKANANPAPVLEISPLIDIPEALESSHVEAEEDPNVLPLYNLSDIAGENHLAVIGGTGAGKSFLTQHLVATYFAGADVVAMDTDASPEEWIGLKVVGRAGNVRQIQDQMGADLNELQRRCALRAAGKPIVGEVVRIIEEHANTAADIQQEIDAVDWKAAGEKAPENTATDWLKRILRRGRKYKMMVVLVSQSFNVKSLKIDGEGDLRENLTVIYLGGKALNALKSIKDRKVREATEQWLKAQQRPALVDVGGILMRFPVPDLSGPVDDSEGYIDVDAYPAQRMTTGATTTIKLDDGSEVSPDYAEFLYKLIKSGLSDGETKTNILKRIGLYGSQYSTGMELWGKLQDQFGEFDSEEWTEE